MPNDFQNTACETRLVRPDRTEPELESRAVGDRATTGFLALTRVCSILVPGKPVVSQRFFFFFTLVQILEGP